MQQSDEESDAEHSEVLACLAGLTAAEGRPVSARQVAIESGIDLRRVTQLLEASADWGTVARVGNGYVLESDFLADFGQGYRACSLSKG